MLDSPLFKKLAEKDPIKLGLSVIIGYCLYCFRGPTLLLKRSFTFEIIFNMAVYILTPYFVLCMLQIIFIEVRDKIAVRHIEKLERTKSIEENDKYFDEVKSQIDKLNKYEYSVVMYLLKKENKCPYIDYESKGHGTILDNEKWFDKSQYDSTTSKTFVTPDKRKMVMHLSGTYQYLLKQNVYNYLKYMLTKTGSISHFKREEIDLKQE